MPKYDIIVVGGGHAGCEASLVCSRLGFSVLMITNNLERIGAMSCNPSIGGVGKGHLVKEIDALGGEMPKVADATGIHFRILNKSRGSAVQATRCQSDMDLYKGTMLKSIQSAAGLSIKQDDVIEVLINEKKEAIGVKAFYSGKIKALAVILATGTFLNGRLHFGSKQVLGGRVGDCSRDGLSESLRKSGIKLGRFKTGTCPRINFNSIDKSKILEQKPDVLPVKFSFDTRACLSQVSCYVVNTNKKTHDVILNSIKKGTSPLYNGQIKSMGPRYCPSIEDKIIRFPDRKSHSVFLEPHGIESNEIYPNGLSTSLDPLLQLKFLRTISGFKDIEVTRFGYAVEYDFIEPTQLSLWLELKKIKNLYSAGQINGTTGYEEAAMQGLVAGINVSSSLSGNSRVVLPRYLSYGGVMIDDLVTRGTLEPYRIFTSRAEYRLALREDNVYRRLSDIAYRVGLVPDKRYFKVNVFEKNTSDFTRKINDICRDADVFTDFSDSRLNSRFSSELRYKSYIKKAKNEIRKYKDFESFSIPEKVFENQLPGISNEVFEILKRIKPKTLGQASRISGITPASLSILIVEIKKSFLKYA